MSFWDCPECKEIMKSEKYRNRKAQCEIVADHVFLLEELAKMHDTGHKKICSQCNENEVGIDMNSDICIECHEENWGEDD